jgi:hypothetical protein
MPHPFNWSVFALGMVIGVASYGWAVSGSVRTGHKAMAPDAESECGAIE